MTGGHGACCSAGACLGLILFSAGLVAEPMAAKCDAPVTALVPGRAALEAQAGRDEARLDAIRDGLFAALERIAGVEIARQSQIVNESSMTGIDRTRRERLTVSGAGRVMSWKILDTDVRASAAGGDDLVLDMEVVVCVDSAADLPMIVAIEIPTWLRDDGPKNLGERVAEILASSGQGGGVVVSRDPPREVYHDIAVGVTYEASVEAVDKRPAADLLARLGGGSILPDEALVFELMELTATVEARRFIDAFTISETVTRKGRLGPGDDPAAREADLLEEAVLMATQRIADRVGDGELRF